MIFVILAICTHFLWEQRSRSPVGYIQLRELTQALLVHFRSGRTDIFPAKGSYVCIVEAVVCEQKLGLPVVVALSSFSDRCDEGEERASQAWRAGRLLFVKLVLVLVCTMGVRIVLTKSLAFMHLEDAVTAGMGTLVLAGVFSAYLNMVPREVWDASPPMALGWMREILESRKGSEVLAIYKAGVSATEDSRRLKRRTAAEARAESDLQVTKWLEYQPVVELIWAVVAMVSLLGFPIVEFAMGA